MNYQDTEKFKKISTFIWKKLNVIIRLVYWILPVKFRKFVGLTLVQGGTYFISLSGTYHPVEYLNISIKSKARDTYERWNIIKKVIMDNNIKNLIDLGCAEGYFVRKSADEFNCVSAGIDSQRERITTAFNSVLFNKQSTSGFFFTSISKDFLNNLPQFDMILCMSIMHHVMAEKGDLYVLELIKILKTKTNKVLIYEMGQSNEFESEWSHKLPDMGDDPYKWISSFLTRAGYKKVEMIGETDTFSNRSQVKRGVFAAFP